jgi:anti-anti-sigma factor
VFVFSQLYVPGSHIVSSAYRHLRITASEGIPVIILTDVKFLDRETIQGAQEELLTYLETTKPTRLIINFQNVTAISSEFISTLLRCREYVKSVDGEFCLSNMNPVVRMAFKVTKIDGKLVHIFDTVALAAAALKRLDQSQ